MIKILMLALCGAVVGVGAVRAMDAFGVLVVYTPSVAEGVYLRQAVEPTRTLRRDDVVCLDATSKFAPAALRKGVASGRFPAAWRRDPLVKHVGALAGAELGYDSEQGVLVDGVALANSKRKAVDLAGEPLPSPKIPARVPAGHVWLSSTHPDGFDSRYMGPVDVRALTCVAEALWTF